VSLFSALEERVHVAVFANGVTGLVVDLLLDWERQAVCGSMNARFSFGRYHDRHGRQTRSMEWSVQGVLMLGVKACWAELVRMAVHCLA
jgi:hypothetical protein